MATASLLSSVRHGRSFFPLHRPCQYFTTRWISDPNEGGKPRSVEVHHAYNLLQSGYRYMDVRTSDEFNDGHVSGAVNIPYMFKIGEGMSKNPMFLDQVFAHFGKDDEILVGCLSGRRSLMAASHLQTAGFTCVIDVAGGYSAWTENKLPTAT